MTACTFALFSIESLGVLNNLSTLILFNIWPLEQELPAICKLKSLKALDISTAYGSNGNGTYNNPNQVRNHKIPVYMGLMSNVYFQNLAMIVEQLPLLTHLDISGTNLAGTGVAMMGANDKTRRTDIPGLVSRADNPLQFLGLYNTAHSACRRYDIPALRVSFQ